MKWSLLTFSIFRCVCRVVLNIYFFDNFSLGLGSWFDKFNSSTHQYLWILEAALFTSDISYGTELYLTNFGSKLLRYKLGSNGGFNFFSRTYYQSISLHQRWFYILYVSPLDIRPFGSLFRSNLSKSARLSLKSSGGIVKELSRAFWNISI